MTIVETRQITGGVDTHLDTHVAAAVDGNGGLLGVWSFPTTTAGFCELHAWLSGFGSLDRIGVEGTGAYGAGLARFLRGAGVAVIEVGRPNRQARRAHGKSNSITPSRRPGRRCQAGRRASPRLPMATWKRSGCCGGSFTPLVVDELLEHLCEVMRPIAHRAGVEFDCEPLGGSVMVHGVRDHLERAFTNVIGNAIKFTPRGGRVTARCVTDETSDSPSCVSHAPTPASASPQPTWQCCRHGASGPPT